MAALMCPNGVWRLTAANDTVSGPLRIKGLWWRHTAAGSVRIVSNTTGTTTNALFHGILGSAGVEREWFGTGCDCIHAKDGIKVISATMTELYLFAE